MGRSGDTPSPRAGGEGKGEGDTAVGNVALPLIRPSGTFSP